MKDTFYNTCLKISKNALKEFEDINCKSKIKYSKDKKVKICMTQ